MRLNNTTKSLVIVVAALVQMNWGQNVTSVSAQQCLQCFAASGCYRNCNCRCSNPNHSPHVNGCNEDGTASVICQNIAATPPEYSTGSCDVSSCSCVALGSSCQDDEECCSRSCTNGKCDGMSPILIDLKDNSLGFELTSAAEGVVFDLGAQGSLNQVAWTPPDSDVAFLAMDRNSNGQIDDGSELFGNATPLNSGQRASNGFEALVDLDGGAELSDGQIDSSDAIYNRLRLWLDRNHNGLSERDELLSLKAGRVLVVYTDYRESRRVDQHGNAYRFIGTALVRQKQRIIRRRIVDVFLAVGS
jgi:hypothetical protein